jgi:integration host factor subunit alpha
MSLIKKDIAKKVAWKLRISEEKSRKIVNGLIEILKQTLQSGDDILISGFGKFCVEERAERKGRNPKSNEQIAIPARRSVSFRCSPILQDKIERIDRIASMGVDPDTVTELIDFANKLTPLNWIIHEYCSFPDLKPGNLYIEICFANYDSWSDKNVGGEVAGPMKFQKISNIADWGSNRALKSLNKYGDGTFGQIQMNILVDDYDDIKWILVHELAHVGVTRLAAQKLHAWKFPIYLVHNQGFDSNSHGPIFQWAYDILIKRVEKIDDLVAEKCRDDLFYYQNKGQYDNLIRL